MDCIVPVAWNAGMESVIGAEPSDGGVCRFRVWAPHASQCKVHLVHPRERTASMEPREHGYFETTIDEVQRGALYYYRLNDERDLPDPASHSQPRGVHGPSEVIDPSFDWEDATWTGLPLNQYVLYELHTGTYTVEGTFDAVIPHLDSLLDLGITAIEVMPVAAFPGRRNWGYDGVFPYAVQSSYGGPQGLKRLVNACHQKGLAVVLDVVYNHLGPEGNYLPQFGPYFNPTRRTPWGAAVNFDGADSQPVRAYFLENALRWVTEFHIDALRLDAVHAIRDDSSTPFLRELADRIHKRASALGRRIWLLAESEQVNRRLVASRREGGYGLDAQWNDDFHHALHVALTGHSNGYYSRYNGLPDLAATWRKAAAEPKQHIVFSQNHDQVGNRAMGERLIHLTDFESAKLAAATVLLSPFLPLLFMGEEYGEPASFLYFVSHGDRGLIEAVRRGRRSEFEAFHGDGDLPDPQSASTFQRSRLNHSEAGLSLHATLRRFYRELLHLRRKLILRRTLPRMNVKLRKEQKLLTISSPDLVVLLNFHRECVPLPRGSWHSILDSAGPAWEGPGSAFPKNITPRSCMVLTPIH